MRLRATLPLIVGSLALVLSGCATTDKNAPPPAEPAPVATPAPTPPPKQPDPPPTFVLDDVHFDFDKATLKPSATAMLDDIAATLRGRSEVYEVGGHTDSIGSNAYNQGLSERRAAAVHRYLVDRGVRASRLTQRGYGEGQPIATNRTRDGRALNRRVEIKP